MHEYSLQLYSKFLELSVLLDNLSNSSSDIGKRWLIHLSILPAVCQVVKISMVIYLFIYVIQKGYSYPHNQKEWKLFSYLSLNSVIHTDMNGNSWSSCWHYNFIIKFVAQSCIRSLPFEKGLLPFSKNLFLVFCHKNSAGGKRETFLHWEQNS